MHITTRQAEIVKHLLKGKSNSEIAQTMNISVLTVKSQLTHIYKEYNVKSRLQLMYKLTKN